MVFRLFVSFIMTCLAAFLMYHGIYGPRGYYAWVDKRQQFESLYAKHSDLQVQHEILRNKVALLQDRIDVDLIEQYAWQTFQMLPADAKVIVYP